MGASSLAFTRHVLGEVGSAAVFFAGRAPLEMVGIYILEFANGERYVGKTTNIVRRLAAHRRLHGDVRAFAFAAAPADELDSLERAVIAEQERFVSLRNIALTELPGGNEPLEVVIQEVEQVILPWERGQRRTALDQASSARRRHWGLVRRPDYDALLDVLARYVHETVPDPIATAQHLWNVTALPSTGRSREARRLATLNCGGLETLYLIEWREGGQRGVQVQLNIKDDAALGSIGDELLEDGTLIDAHDPAYRQASGVVSLCAPGLAEATRLLKSEPILDAAYRLNVELMRRGTSIFRRHHNAGFAEAILNRIGRLLSR
ncbi:GIY-YIG nuclease family protein [Microbacterium album]|uniref:GIY-YIG domain-containing protein n=1 Tax=Microbacterium album TaxID=2053191 RepID=A0A917IHX3_9MICO|nr:GIY-YIG nuclease family protein [Microbacterium album]GGH45846.1 hypothetical protein GCM10010921_21500 [Microbacterium album]